MRLCARVRDPALVPVPVIARVLDLDPALEFDDACYIRHSRIECHQSTIARQVLRSLKNYASKIGFPCHYLKVKNSFNGKRKKVIIKTTGIMIYIKYISSGSGYLTLLTSILIVFTVLPPSTSTTFPATPTPAFFIFGIDNLSVAIKLLNTECPMRTNPNAFQTPGTLFLFSHYGVFMDNDVYFANNLMRANIEAFPTRFTFSCI
jgi:hypothetical protein